MPDRITQADKKRLTRPILFDPYGRAIDRQGGWGIDHLPHNPDTTDTDTIFDISQNPYIKAGLQFRAIHYLWVSAGGLTQNNDGVDFPAQLIWQTAGDKSDEQYNLLAYQYDQNFRGGFGEILKSLEDPCKTYGRAIGEIDYEKKLYGEFAGKILSPFIHSRDPEEFIFDPADEKPGLYRKGMYGVLNRVDQNKFIAFQYNPLFNNPYGESINLPLKPWVETFNKIFGYWRHALEKAGLGSWVAKYGREASGNDNRAKQLRELILSQVKAIAGGTASIFPQGTELENYKLQMDAQAFLDWYQSFIKTVSVIYTGNAGTFGEEAFGSKAAKESTSVRQESQLELSDSMLINHHWDQFNRRILGLNFHPEKIKAIPQLWIISPAYFTPTTPADQEPTDQEPTDQEPPEMMAELQDEKDGISQDFPRETPTPEPYQAKNIIEAAELYLSEMPVKQYQDFVESDGGKVFTIKGQPGFIPSLTLLESLKAEIIPTLKLDSEGDAWQAYVATAKDILEDNGIQTTEILLRDLSISFRQARQTAFSRGLINFGVSDNAAGIRIKNLKDGHIIRFIHKQWDGVVLAMGDHRIETVLPPSDFGCVCFAELVYDINALTPENEIPVLLPGESYKLYADE